MVQVRLGTAVVRTPSSTRPGFELMAVLQIMTVHFMSLETPANHLAISDFHTYSANKNNCDLDKDTQLLCTETIPSTCTNSCFYCQYMVSWPWRTLHVISMQANELRCQNRNALAMIFANCIMFYVFFFSFFIYIAFLCVASSWGYNH